MTQVDRGAEIITARSAVEDAETALAAATERLTTLIADYHADITAELEDYGYQVHEGDAVDAHRYTLVLGPNAPLTWSDMVFLIGHDEEERTSLLTTEHVCEGVSSQIAMTFAERYPAPPIVARAMHRIEILTREGLK